MKKILLFAAVAAGMLFASCDNVGKTAKLENQQDSLVYLAGASEFGRYIGTPENIKNILLQTGSDTIYLEEFLLGVQDGFKGAEDKKNIAFNMGVSLGMQLRSGMAPGINHVLYGNDSTQQADLTNLLIGFMDAANDTLAVKGANNAKLNAQEIGAMLNRLAQVLNDERVKKQYAAEIEKENKYLAELAKKEDIKQLQEGVCYKELTAGDGKVLGAGKTVKVEYEGRLLDGTVFDKGTLDAVAIGQGRVIPGFDMALAAMSVGAEWEVTIPALMAYGEQAQPKIPAMSTLVFKVKVVEEVKQDKAAAQPMVLPMQ